MAEKSYNQSFNGYYVYPNRGSITEKSGIYCVYAGVHNKETNKVSLRQVLYIGQAENIKSRIQNHECYDKWAKHLNRSESIIFSYTLLSVSELDRFEAAMIYKHKPPVNDLNVDHFRYDKTNVVLNGETALLTTNFTVDRTDY